MACSGWSRSLVQLSYSRVGDAFVVKIERGTEATLIPFIMRLGGEGNPYDV